MKQIGASAIYLVNWVLAADSVDYLAASNVPTIVQQFWSLSVEEQFYIGWPVLLFLAVPIVWRLGRSQRPCPAVAYESRLWWVMAGLMSIAFVG